MVYKQSAGEIGPLGHPAAERAPTVNVALLRVHRCEACQLLFECTECTEAVASDYAIPSAGVLYSVDHSPLAVRPVRWLCPECR